ncbi:hypothetical protein G5I_09653 [Acromyrmex echinatior]|uniref:Uncharacterized protein n=1 Tax=Acromyrmex echinatior TaxID=103372 RepID=F4WUS5_ACREC|nr:hypothetical protein G5I_09653 [Acromyrmex echinatior]
MEIPEKTKVVLQLGQQFNLPNNVISKEKNRYVININKSKDKDILCNIGKKERSMFESCVQTSSTPLNATDSETMLDYKLFTSGTMQLDQNNNNSDVSQQPDRIVSNRYVHKVMISLARLATLENRAMAGAVPTTVSLFSLETYGENLKYEMMVEARMNAAHKIEVEKLLYAALVSADTTLSAPLSHSPLSPMRRFRIVECARLASVKGCTTVQKRGVATATSKLNERIKS